MQESNTDGQERIMRCIGHNFLKIISQGKMIFSDADANADADVETPMPRLPNSYFVMVFLIILVWKFFKYKTSR